MPCPQPTINSFEGATYRAATFPILLIDDDPLLAEVLTRAAKSHFPEAHFHPVYGSEEAKNYIEQLAGYGPLLVLLDINLSQPRDGFDLLAYLQGHPQARLLPVLILTVSQRPTDIRLAYEKGAASFMVKPFTYEQWPAYLANLRQYWLKTVSVPTIIFQQTS